MYEFLAKNVGIRRASGRFVMGHALDTIITEKWWEDVGAHKLLDRVERLAKAKGAEYLMHRMVRADSVVRLKGSEPCERVEAALAARVSELQTCNGRTDFEMKPLAWQELAQVMDRTDACIRSGKKHFTEASGDFQLMTREAWERVRGYAERNTYAHFDSVLMYTANQLGVRVHGHLKSVSDPNSYYVIWHQGHTEGGYIARMNMYDRIETPFWKYRDHPLWGYAERSEWGMPRHHFEEVVWLHGKKQEPSPVPVLAENS